MERIPHPSYPEGPHASHDGGGDGGALRDAASLIEVAGLVGRAGGTGCGGGGSSEAEAGAPTESGWSGGRPSVALVRSLSPAVRLGRPPWNDVVLVVARAVRVPGVEVVSGVGPCSGRVYLGGPVLPRATQPGSDLSLASRLHSSPSFALLLPVLLLLSTSSMARKEREEKALQAKGGREGGLPPSATFSCQAAD